MTDDQDSEETMGTKSEAPLGCLWPKTTHGAPHENGNIVEANCGQKDKLNSQPGGVESNNLLLGVMGAPANLGQTRPFYQHECLTWPYIYHDIQKVRQSYKSTFENHFYPPKGGCYFPADSRIHYVPLRTFPQGHQHELQSQQFQYFVVIDFEATCDKEKKPNPQEIIEFPSVLVNSMTGQLEASFQTYVRPAYHQHLTDFCKELTGIQQIQVDRGVPLGEALLMHDKWLEDKGIKHRSFAVVTWGNWDCNTMLESECRFKRIRKPPYFNRWINLKVPFQDVFGGIRCNLKEAVQLAGLTWEGRPHCGLDDARNTARLLALLMHRGFRFSITNEMLPLPTDHPLTHQTFNHHHRPIDPTQQPPALKEVPVGVTVPVPGTHFHPFTGAASKEWCAFCFCGVPSSKCVILKPGPMQGRYFFGCGNWTSSTPAAVCNYFVWASP